MMNAVCSLVRRMVRTWFLLGDRSNEGWPTSLEVGSTNSTSEFVIPTAKAMGHPSSRIMRVGVLVPAVLIGLAVQSDARGADAPDSEKPSTAYADLQPAVTRPSAPETAPPPPPPQAIRHLEAGRKLHDQQRYTEAILELEKALRYDPNNHQVHILLALTCQQSGNEGRATAHVERALKANPDDITGHYLQGLGAKALDQNDEAVRAFRVALLCSNAGPDNPFTALTAYQLAGALHSAGYLAAAIEQYEHFEAITLDPAPGLLENAELADLVRVSKGLAALRIGEAHLALGQTDRAATALGRAAAAKPSDPAIRARYGRILVTARRIDEALTVARGLIEEFPDSAEGVDLLIRAHETAGRSDAALADLQQIAQRHTNNVALTLSLADALNRHGRRDQAVEILRRVIEEQPEALEAQWKLVELLVAHAPVDDVVSVLMRVLHRDSSESAYGRMQGQVGALVARTDAVADYLEAFDDRLADAGDDYARAAILAAVAAAADQPDRAEHAYRAALEAKSDYVPAQLALGRIYLDRAQWQKAIGLAESAGRAAKRNSTVERQLGEARDGLDEHEPAVEHYKNALRLARRDRKTLWLLAQLYERTGQRNLAQQRYLEILRLDSGDARAREALIRTYLTSGDSAGVKNAQTQLEGFGSGADAPHAFGRCQALVKRVPGGATAEQFRTALNDLLDKHDDDAETRVELALSFARSLDYGEVDAQLAAAAKLGPLPNRGRELRALARQKRLDFETATTIYRDMLERHPNREPWIRSLYHAQRLAQDYDSAAESLQRLLALESAERNRYRRWLGHTLERAGRAEQAVESARAWFKADPEDDVRRGLLTEVLLRNEQPDEAVALNRDALEADPTNANARQLYLGSLLEAKQFDDAFAYVLEWLTDDPEGPVLVSQFSAALQAADRHDDAIEWLRSDLALAAAPPRGQRPTHQINGKYRLFMAYAAAKRNDEAIELLRTLARDRLVPAITRLEFNLRIGSRLLDAKRFTEAEQHLRALLERIPERQAAVRGQIRRLLAGGYQLNGQPQSARAELNQILETTSKASQPYIGACNDLGYTLADAGQDLDRAEELIRFAVGEDPDNSAYLDSLGWVLYKKGDYEGARLWLTRATRTLAIFLPDPTAQSDDPVVIDHLGDALWRLGDRDGALVRWREAAAGLHDRVDDARTDDAKVLANAEAKIAAVGAGQSPPVAPPAPSDKKDE